MMAEEFVEIRPETGRERSTSNEAPQLPDRLLSRERTPQRYKLVEESELIEESELQLLQETKLALVLVNLAYGGEELLEKPFGQQGFSAALRSSVSLHGCTESASPWPLVPPLHSTSSQPQLVGQRYVKLQ